MQDVDPHLQNKTNTHNLLDSNVIVLPTDIEYLDQLVQVQRAVYNVPPQYWDHPELLNEAKFAEHLQIFPEGQFMALDVLTDTVVGTCTSMIVDIDLSRPLLKPWAATTGNGYLRPHNPGGEWLYGVDNVVLKSYRGQGVGGRLMKARYNVARKLNLRGMIAGSMPIDYYKAAEEGVSIEDYVADVIAGKRWDTNLSKQLKKGMRVLNVIPNYLSDAPRTLNYGVAIAWDNPDYRPSVILPERPRAAKGATPRIQPGTSTSPGST